MPLSGRGVNPRLLDRWLFLIDLILFPAAFLVCLSIFNPLFSLSGFFSYHLIAYVAINLFTYWATGRYSPKNDFVSSAFLCEYGIVGVICVVAVFVYTFTYGQMMDQKMPVNALLISTLICQPVSWYFKRRLFIYFESHQESKEVVVVGTGEDAQALCDVLSVRCPKSCVSFFSLDDSDAGKPLFEGQAASPIIQSGLEAYLDRRGDSIRSVVLSGKPGEYSEKTKQFLVHKSFMGMNIQSLMDFYSSKWQYYPSGDLDLFWISNRDNLNQHSSLFSYGAVKLICDKLFAFLGLIFLSPLLLLFAIAIRLESKGPALFKQQRLGFNGKKFTLYKLRSMVGGPPQSDVSQMNSRNRITRIGKFIRKARIDEIPQLWNVLKGDMSLIGPRPEWDVLVEKYEKEIDHYHYRHYVKPGITGWAQVNFRYAADVEDTLEKLKYDLYYVQNCSIKLDLMVVIKTVYTILGLKGV